MQGIQAERAILRPEKPLYGMMESHSAAKITIVDNNATGFRNTVRKTSLSTHEVPIFRGVVRKKGCFTHGVVVGCPVGPEDAQSGRKMPGRAGHDG